jgi:RHS repeat-associated protein
MPRRRFGALLGWSRRSALQDANWNVTAIVDHLGVLQERYRYHAYGTPEFLVPSFDESSAQYGSFDWETLYAGYRFDAELGAYQVRNRHLNPAIGVWLTRDPVGETSNGNSVYAYGGSRPLAATDAFGLWVWPWDSDASWGIADTFTGWGANPASAQTLEGLLTNPLDTIADAANPESVKTLKGLLTDPKKTLCDAATIDNPGECIGLTTAFSVNATACNLSAAGYGFLGGSLPILLEPCCQALSNLDGILSNCSKNLSPDQLAFQGKLQPYHAACQNTLELNDARTILYWMDTGRRF